MSVDPLQDFAVPTRHRPTDEEKEHLAWQRRRAVRNLAGWPCLDADAVRELCDALGLDPKEGT